MYAKLLNLLINIDLWTHIEQRVLYILVKKNILFRPDKKTISVYVFMYLIMWFVV